MSYHTEWEEEKWRTQRTLRTGTSQFDDQKEKVEMAWACWTKRW